MAKTLPMIANFDDIPADALVPAAEQPYKIPAHWKWVWFGSVANFIGGGTPDKSVSSFWDGEILWASVKDLHHPRITRTINTITEEGLANSSTSLCDVGDLVLATRITPGKSAIATVPIAINQDLKIVKTQLLVPEYLQYYLNSQTCWFETNSSGSTVKGIRISSLALLPVPLAPLDIQHGIVRRIEQANVKINKVLGLLGDFVEAVSVRRAELIEAGVSGCLTQDWRETARLRPDSWKKTTLGESLKWSSGGTPSRKNPSYFSGSIPWLKSGELPDGYITTSEEHISEDAVSNSSAKIFPKNSVLIAMYGATIGKVGILQFDAATNQAIAAAMPSDCVKPEFLAYFLEAKRPNFIALGKGGAQANISQTIIKSFPLDLPTIEEQHVIVSRISKGISQLEKCASLVKQAIAELNFLKDKLRASALAGTM